MKYEEELYRALRAAEAELDELDHCGVLLVTEVGDYGIQIAIGDQVDALTVRAALRGAADRLDGIGRPILADVQAALRARGWKLDGDGYTHPGAGDRTYDLVAALGVQTMMEIARS